MARQILTVGHSTHPIDVFLDLLRGAEVEQVVDVRRFPGSRRNPQYGAEALTEVLAESAIGYEHVGQLGGRRPVLPGSCNDGWETSGFRGYADHLRTPEFAEGLARLEDLARKSHTVVMCAEAAWWRCHRRLVADVLVLRGWEVGHLMSGGRLVEHRPPEFMIAAADGLPCYPAAGAMLVERANTIDLVSRAAEGEAQAQLQKAQEAVQAGDWPAAREGFEAALVSGTSGEALFGLGVALQWLGDTESAIRHWERAYVEFRRLRDAQQAVLAAFYLCLGYQMILGNNAASRGWCQRAASVVEDLDAPELHGWVELARAYVAIESADPLEGELHARKALEIARATADSDLELCSKSELGAALVASGRWREGTALLDEAMAGALAGEGDLDTVVLISCRTVASCDRGGDVRRATQWVRAADEFNRRYGSPHLYTTCRTHYGGILFAAGKWADAERELGAALEVGGAAEPDLHAEALARLAELRLAQGRVEEAVRLLDGYVDHPAAACAIAAVNLARDVPSAAANVLGRRLREVEAASLEGVALSELLVEAELAQGALAAATARAEQLADLASRVDSQLVAARAQRALGRARAAADAPDAVAPLEAALAAFRRLDMPFEGARTRLLIAAALADRNRETAIAEARAALAAFEELGAGPGADATAALLRALGVKAARSGPRGVGLLTKRELEVLELLGEGLSNPAIAERLFITRKTVEHHVGSVLSKLELSGRSEAAAYAVRHLTQLHDSASK